MSIWSDIEDGITQGANTISDGVKQGADGMANGVKKGVDEVGNLFRPGGGGGAFDFVAHVLQSGALAMGDGANLFSAGWEEVFSGRFKDGLNKVAVGIAETQGIAPPQVVKQYEQAIGQASLLSVQHAKQKNQRQCYSEYLSQVKANFANQGLQWNDTAEQNLRGEIPQLPWIDPNC